MLHKFYKNVRMEKIKETEMSSFNFKLAITCIDNKMYYEYGELQLLDVDEKSWIKIQEDVTFSCISKKNLNYR